MKTTIEINGYEIVIQEIDGVISVSAVKDDEVIEEFEIQSGDAQSEGDESEEAQDFDGDEIQDFDEFGAQEDSDDDDESQDELEEDEAQDSDDESQDEFEEDEKQIGESKLESFNSFLKKRK